MAPENHEERIRMIASAHLRSQGYNQVDIAERVGISQPEVSRLLTKAVGRKLLRPHPTFLRESVTDAEFNEAEALYGSAFEHLEAKSRKLVPRGLEFKLHVVSAADLTSFCDLAARHVAALIADRAQVVGTMWGSTSDKIIDGITRYARASRGSSLRAIPLAGDPLYLINQETLDFSGSALAGKLELAFTGRKLADLPTLNGVPAYISQALMSDSKKAKVLRDFYRNIPGYKRIFGEGGYVHDLDTVLTGVGVMSADPQHTATFIREREEQEGAAFERARPFILGDFAGWMLPKPGLKTTENDLVEDLNQGWTGISLDQLKTVASDAPKKSKPGVIAVAFGTEKAAVLRETIKRKLINHLVVDEKLAGHLVEIA